MPLISSLLSFRRLFPLLVLLAWLLVVWMQVAQHPSTTVARMNLASAVTMQDFVSQSSATDRRNHSMEHSSRVQEASSASSKSRRRQSLLTHADEDLQNSDVTSASIQHQAIPRRNDPMPDNLPDYARFNNYQNLPSYIPPLDSLIDPSPLTNHSIIGNASSYLLDFAIIGFGKCGTSTLMHWLADHAETQVLRSEMWSLVGQQPHYLIARLHRTLQAQHLFRGYKCPGDILQPHALQYYHALFPAAKLFVGVRHPIWHMQSLYNFRIQNFVDASMKHPNRLIGACYAGHKMTCTLKSDWAYYLFQMGKHLVRADGTRVDDYPLSDLEDVLINRNPYRPNPYTVTDIQPIRNPVFLFELGQLGDTNETRRTQFQTDVQHYLGLNTPLAPVHHFVPGREWPPAVQAARDRLKINICEYDYIPLRRELLRQATLSADWIEQVFLSSHQVFSSNPEHLRELLATWRVDPCGPESMQVSQEESHAILQRTRNAPDNTTKLELLAFLKANTPVD